MNIKHLKRASGLIGLIFLLSCLLSSASPIFATTEEEVSSGSSWETVLESEKYRTFMNPAIPETFETSPNPTETDEDTPLLLCEENELLTFQSYDNRKKESDGGSSKLYVTNQPQNSTDAIDVTDDIVENLKETTAGIYGLNSVQGVAFDPDKTGRRDHVAFVGIGQDKIPYLVIYNAVDQTWGSKYQINVGMDWIDTSDTNAYQLKDVLSITAGDYNRDFHDTVVVFASFYGTCNDIFEFQVDDLTISRISDAQKGAELLHPNYFDSDYASYFYNKSNKWGRNQIHAQLETGDVNNDGVDDLVCLSWMNKPDKMTDNVFYYRTMSPYLNVALGSTTATTVLDGDFSEKGQYIDTGDSLQNNNSRMTTTLYAPGFAIGHFDESGDNTIVVAGRGNTLTTKKDDDTCDGYQLADRVNVATVSINPNGTMVKPTFSTGAISQMNELTKHTTKDKDAICSSTLEAVAFDGPDASDYLFFDGDIYSMASGTPELVQPFATTRKSGYNEDNKKWGDYGDITYISATAIGNFDGESGYYETIYFTLMTKNNESQDDYHCRTARIFGKERDAITNQITEWGCTETAPTDIYDKGDNFDQGLADIVVAIDNDGDGTLLKYKDKACYYSDPEILTILQASPYFEEIDDLGLTEIGNSGITISESYGTGTGEEFSHDLSVGFCFNFSHDKWDYESDNSASYTRNMTQGWETSVSYTNDVTFWATLQDQVIVYRTPIYVYSYYVWDPESEDWLYDEDDLFMSYVAQRPVYSPMRVDEYDTFAKAYNEGMAEKTAELIAKGETNLADYEELITIGDSDYAYLLGHEGDPYGYQNTGGKTLSSSPIQLSHSAGNAGYDYSICADYTKYKSESNGYSLATEQRWEVGNSGWHLGFDFEMSDSWTNSGSTTWGTGVTFTAWVGGVVSKYLEGLGYHEDFADNYNFTWDVKVYDTDIPGKGIPICYEKDKNKNLIYYNNVQIIGFKTYNVSSPPAPPEVDPDAKYQERTNSLKITWEKSEDATGGYRILRQMDPRDPYNYAEIATVGKNVTSYSFDDFEAGVTDYVFTVQSIDEKGNFGLRSEEIWGSADIPETTGQNIYQGTGDPQKNLGKIGDYYLDKKTKNLYRKNENGWTLAGNLNNYDFSSTQNITSGGINIDVYCGSNVTKADQDLIESKVNAGKLKIENINEDIKDKAMRNVLAVMFADSELSDEDINLFLKDPDNKIVISPNIIVLVKSADIVGADAPYIEYMVNAKISAHIVSKTLNLDKTFIYEINPSDFAENASVDMELPVCGKYVPESIVHMSNDGKDIYGVYTENGSKQFVYDEATGVVKFSADHFSRFRINGKAGSNKTAENTGFITVNTGVINSDETMLCFALVLLMLAGFVCFGFVKSKKE